MARNVRRAVQAPRAPSAPAAPPVRAIAGAMAQNRSQMLAAAKKGPTGGVKPGAGQPKKPQKPGPTGGVKPGKGPKPKWKEKPKKPKQPAPTAPPVEPAAPPGAAPTPYVPPPDPRDDQYWANVRALEAQFAIQDQQLATQQTYADNAFALESAQMDEYNNRRQRAIAENRMGRGLRSGGFRRERALNDMDYMMDTGRRGQAKSAADFDRTTQRGMLRAQLDADIQQAEIDSADRYAQGMANEAAEGGGDAQDMEGTFAAEDKAAKDKKLNNKLKTVNQRIRTLKAKKDNAGPNQKKKINARIKKLSTQRTKIKGKLK
jgi:hypothetical protein